MGGGNFRIAGPLDYRYGLSPRGRGKHDGRLVSAAIRGSIPAWAGETTSWTKTKTSGRVYPRVGGGNGFMLPSRSPAKGLSPRGRGKRIFTRSSHALPRSIPAWAGETGPLGRRVRATRVYPRVGGGNLLRPRGTMIKTGLSPRGRGKPTPTQLPEGVTRSIPAWAGETVAGFLRRRPGAVYPRVGGGN